MKNVNKNSVTVTQDLNKAQIVNKKFKPSLDNNKVI